MKPPRIRLPRGLASAARPGAGPRRNARRGGAVALIVACFLGSAAIRLLDPAGPFAAFAAEVMGAGHAPDGGRAAAQAAAECGPTGDAGALLQAVRQREAQLDARASAIADRERMLAAAEARLREERARIDEARTNLQATLTLADDAAEADIRRLVAVYENMDPKKSSKIFETMDLGFAAGFLARMRQDVAAQVLAGLPAERAYAISAMIAGRNARVPKE